MFFHVYLYSMIMLFDGIAITFYGLSAEFTVKRGLFGQRMEEKILASTGSAFCVHENGLFLTNAHVVSDVSTNPNARVDEDHEL